MTPLGELMVVLGRIDKSDWLVRDLLILWIVSKFPGIAGNDIPPKIGLKTRSQIQYNILHLLRTGMIEDKRKRMAKTIPGILYITSDGQKLLNSVTEIGGLNAGTVGTRENSQSRARHIGDLR